MTTVIAADNCPVSEPTPMRNQRHQHPVRTMAALVGIVTLALTLSGCLQLNAQFSVRKDDTVSGRILVAGDTPSEMSVLDRFSPPAGLEHKVRITNYAANGFSGKEIYFTQLSFTEVDALSLSINFDGVRPYSLGFRRSGNTVTFSGTVDLSRIPPEKAASASSRIDLSFPAEIHDTDGTMGNDNSVSWSPKPGSVTRMHASSSYPDPAARGFAVWMIVGIGGALLVAIAVILAARRSRARADHLIDR